MLESIPTNVDPKQLWLVDYWAAEMGVSAERLLQAIKIVGQEVSKLRKYLSDGHRIAICDGSGNCHLVARITLEKGGFAISVPYSPVKRGCVLEAPLQYDKTDFVVSVSDCKTYIVNDSVKLSLHMDGFVQFSQGGGQKIVSGYCTASGEIKGAGIRSSQSVTVSTGPLCGVIAQGIEEFEMLSKKQAEVFEASDLWHNPDFSNADDTAYNLEVFMLPNSELNAVQTSNEKRILKRNLPFKSSFKFLFTLRVIELPGQPYFLGVIVSRIRPKSQIGAGYSISSPGCWRSDGQATSITAMYPRPDFVDELNTTSLDYRSE